VTGKASSNSILVGNPEDYGEFVFRFVRLTACADLATKLPLVRNLLSAVTCQVKILISSSPNFAGKAV
jgi:hypothetical protein